MKKIFTSYLLVIFLMFLSLVSVDAQKTDEITSFPVGSTTGLSDTLSLLPIKTQKKNRMKRKENSAGLNLRKAIAGCLSTEHTFLPILIQR